MPDTSLAFFAKSFIVVNSFNSKTLKSSFMPMVFIIQNFNLVDIKTLFCYYKPYKYGLNFFYTVLILRRKDMEPVITDEQYKIIASEIYQIYNIQVLLEQSLSLIELDGGFEVEPHLMLIRQQKQHIKSIISLI